MFYRLLLLPPLSAGGVSKHMVCGIILPQNWSVKQSHD